MCVWIFRGLSEMCLNHVIHIISDFKRVTTRVLTAPLMCGLLMAVAMLAGCAAPAPFQAARPVTHLQWPALSSQPRIVWLKTISTHQDVGIAKDFWRKIVELLTGPDDTRISRPYGVLFDDGGRLFVADPGAGVVHVMDTKAGRYDVIGAGGGSFLRSPIGLAEDENENLYITDSSAATVFIYDIRHKTLKPFLRDLKRPTGIAYNRSNKLLYIVDTVAGRVISVDGRGNRIHSFGSPGDGNRNFNHPTDITVDQRGQIYVTDPLNYRIKIFSPEGQLVSQTGAAGDSPGELNKPKGVAIDSDGHIYVCDALQDTVQIFENTGALIMNFGSKGSGAGQLWMPSGIFIDKDDYIYVADTYNHRIQLFRYFSKKRFKEPEDDFQGAEPTGGSMPQAGNKP